MKKLFLFYLVSTTLFSGTPLQDPEIKQLREKFKIAKTPTRNQLHRSLRFGHVWTCTERLTYQDNFTLYEEYSFLFVASDEGVTNQAAHIVKDFKFVGSHLVGTGINVEGDQSELMTFIKVTKNGSLLAEVTHQNQFENISRSLSNPRRFALGYIYCEK